MGDCRERRDENRGGSKVPQCRETPDEYLSGLPWTFFVDINKQALSYLKANPMKLLHPP